MEAVTSSSTKVLQYTREEVSQHSTPGDLWIVIDSQVFDVSRFQAMHPGGASVFVDEGVPGQDVTEAFYSLHRHEILKRPQFARLQIGVIRDERPQLYGKVPGMISDIPYAEPSWLAEGFTTPYYTEGHRRFQKAVRKFVEEVVYPDAQARELDGKRPSQYVIDAMADLNLHAMRMGPGKHLQGRKLMNGLVKPEEFDYFHELIIQQEIIKCGSRCYGDGLNAGCVIGLPPVLNFGNPQLRARVVPEVLGGKKFICLAISEAGAGSDVFGLQTTARKSADGKHWIISGSKKWITNGTFADYFTVGCKTDDGFTVILVERSEGVTTRPIKMSYPSAAGTAYISFDNVKVPIENTLGEEGGGIFVMLSNFNHERWVMCCTSISTQRFIYEETIKWVHQRKAFDKPLVSQPVVRNKLAAIISRIESAQNWLENITYQMCNMDYKEQAGKLAGQIAFLKVQSTSTAQDTAHDVVQLFGGRSLTATGMGRFIEQYHRIVPYDAILGGAEDVLADLGVRQAMRSMPKDARL